MVTLSSSTLGAPGLSLEQVLAALRQSGLSGVELRLSGGQLTDPAMTRAARREVGARLVDAGVTVTGLASYVRMGSDAPDDLVVGALVAALDLAADVGAPLVRVFPGAPADPCPDTEIPTLREATEEVAERMARRLDAVAGFVAECGVTPALETHDSHPTGALVADVLARTSGPVGAVWDLMHPWRVGEPLTETWAALRPWLVGGRGAVQVKDAGLPADHHPRLLGRGTLPLADFATLLIGAGFDGTVALEWERTWFPDAEPFDVACADFAGWAGRFWPDALAA